MSMISAGKLDGICVSLEYLKAGVFIFCSYPKTLFIFDSYGMGRCCKREERVDGIGRGAYVGKLCQRVH